MPHYCTVILYFLFVFLTCFFALCLSKTINALESKSKLSGALLGGIFLAIATSLPELVTTISSIFIEKVKGVGLACGDILGSNLFDLFAIGICLIVTIHFFTKARLEKTNWMMCIALAGQCLFVFLAIIFDHIVTIKGFNFLSLGVVLIYGIILAILVHHSKQNEQQKISQNEQKQIAIQNNEEGIRQPFWKIEKYSKKVIFILFFIISLILVAVSVYLTFLARDVNEMLGLNSCFGGALLLGIVTSAPEFICTIHLCIVKNYEIAISDIAGSCIFNKTILFIANICSAGYLNKSLFAVESKEALVNLYLQIGLISLMSLFFALYCVFNASKIKEKLNNKIINTINVISLGLVSACYVAFLLFSIFYKI